MRTFGIVVLILSGIGMALYFGGFVSGKADVELTDKGRQTIQEGVDTARDGLSDALRKGAEKVQNAETPAVPEQ